MCQQCAKNSDLWFSEAPPGSNIILYFSSVQRSRYPVTCGWIEGCSSCYNIPRYLVWDRRIHRFQFFPDVFSKTSVVCISVLEAVEILTIPFFEVICAVSLSFNMIVVKSCDGSSVDNICHCTSSWHGTFCLSTSLTIAMKILMWVGIHQLLMILKDFVVMLS